MAKKPQEPSVTSKKEEIAEEKLEDISGGRAIQMNTHVSTSATAAEVAAKRRVMP